MAAGWTETMAKAAHRYDLYPPLTYNDGRPIADERFDEVELQLVNRFGGVTSQQRGFPLRGVWQGQTQLFFDQVVIMTALDFRRRGSADFVGRLKRDLLQDFEQLEILITESALRVH